MDSPDFEKSNVLFIAESIAYSPAIPVTKTIVRKNTGTISATILEAGMSFENTAPHDTFVQIIDGSAEISIDDQSSILDVGQCIIIPAHSRTAIVARVRVKMITTVIKSAY